MNKTLLKIIVIIVFVVSGVVIVKHVVSRRVKMADNKAVKEVVRPQKNLLRLSL